MLDGRRIALAGGEVTPCGYLPATTASAALMLCACTSTRKRAVPLLTSTEILTNCFCCCIALSPLSFSTELAPSIQAGVGRHDFACLGHVSGRKEDGPNGPWRDQVEVRGRLSGDRAGPLRLRRRCTRGFRA